MVTFDIVLFDGATDVGIKKTVSLPVLPRRGDQIWIPIGGCDSESDHLEEDFIVQHSIREKNTQVIIDCDLDFIANIFSRDKEWKRHEFFMSDEGEERLKEKVQEIENK